jgi:alpha-D-ribose 1-methylphosphonate 5-triphosphate diphosphatase
LDQALVIENAQVVTEHGTFLGSVGVRAGNIFAMDTGPIAGAGMIDLDGDYLLPGLIDIHTDNLERHMLPRNNADWPVMAALVAHDAQLATSGITTVLDSLCVGTAGNGVRDFAKVEQAIGQIAQAKQRDMFRVDHLLHLRCELSHPGFIEMFSQVYARPDVRLISLMDHTPGQRQWADLEKYIAMEKRDFKLSQEEIDAFVAQCRESHDKYAEPNRRALLAMVAERDVVLASHDDTTLEHIEQAHREGIHISEFPTTLAAAHAARERGMHIVAGAPNLVLGRSHSGNVSAEDLARAALVDVLSSDYAPSSLLYGAFLLANKIGVPLHEAIATVTRNPARLVGLNDRGTIAVGKRADLIRVRMVDGLPLVTMVWRAGTRVA